MFYFFCFICLRARVFGFEFIIGDFIVFRASAIFWVGF